MALGKEKMSPSREARPLSGRRIVVTRARSQASVFVHGIEDHGGEVVEFPTIEILPPKSYDPLDEAIEKIKTYYWIIFTSANGVSYFLDRMQYLGQNIDDLKETRIAAIGPETAKALESVKLRADLVPQEYRAEAILQGLKPDEMVGKRVLLPRAAEARDVLPKTLREWGSEVDVVEAYRTVAAKSDAPWLRTLLLRKKIDMITFTSSSTVTHFVKLFQGEDIRGFLAGTAVACIGPITQESAEAMGLRVDVVPRDYTIPGLIEAIVEYFTRQEATGNRQ